MGLHRLASNPHFTLCNVCVSSSSRTGGSNSDDSFLKSHPSDLSVASLQFLLIRKGNEVVRATRSGSWKLRLDIVLVIGGQDIER